MNLDDYKLLKLLLLKKDLLEKIVFQNDNFSFSNSNVAIVFGNSNEYKERLNKAFELYKNGNIEKIIVSGGYGYYPSLKKEIIVPEAIRMNQYALTLGFDKKDIIIEDKSKTTEENIILSFELLKNKHFDFKNLLLISSDYHIKRCYELALNILKNYNTNSNLQAASNKYSLINKDNWDESINGITTIKKEAVILKMLQKKGKIRNYDF